MKDPKTNRITLARSPLAWNPNCPQMPLTPEQEERKKAFENAANEAASKLKKK